MPVVHYDTATWLAFRSQQSANIGPAELPERVTLPGTRASIDRLELKSLQASGLKAHQIVKHVNDRWATENAHRVLRHEQWVERRYIPTIERYRRAKQEAAGKQARRNALMEQMLNEYVESHPMAGHGDVEHNGTRFVVERPGR